MVLLQRFNQNEQVFSPDKGICLPMSMHFLMEEANGRSFWEWFKKHTRRAYVFGRGQQNEMPSNYLQKLNKHGLMLRDTVNFATRELPLHLFMEPNEGPYRIVVMMNERQAQGHAIACILTGGVIRVLDVSEGEFRFERRYDGLTWLSTHLNTPRIAMNLGPPDANPIPRRNRFPREAPLRPVLSYINGMTQSTMYRYNLVPSPPSDPPPPPPPRQ